jgi:hypothetical protein
MSGEAFIPIALMFLIAVVMLLFLPRNSGGR